MSELLGSSDKDKGQTVGYLRVSSVDQNEMRQLDGVAIDRRFVDQCSGSTTSRPGLESLIAYVRQGDSVVIHSMDRLARNLDDLRRLVTDFTSRGVRVRFIKESLEFSGNDSPMSNLLLNVIGAVAQFEREMIRERQREGVAIAKKNGRYKGRAVCLKLDRAREVRARANGGESKTALAREYGISVSSVYRFARENALENVI